MRTMVPQVRRLPKALLIAALTALVFGGLLGTAQATDGQASDADTLDVPRPAVGDRWTYQALLSGPWNFGPNDPQSVGVPFPFAEFEWQQPVLVRDEAGFEVAADLLHVHSLDYRHDPDSAQLNEGHLWVPDEDRYLFRLGTPETFAKESRIETTDRMMGGGAQVGGVPVPLDQENQVRGWSRSFGPAWAPCLARTLLQEGPLDLDKPLHVAADCLPALPIDWEDDEAAWSWEWLEAKTSFTFAGRDLVAGRSTFRFESQDATIWLSEEVPIPVQWQSKDRVADATVTLTSFVAGSQPLGTLGPMAGPSQAPALQFAPRQLWGPDDTGSGHPFPASAAFQAAAGSPTWNVLRNWLAAHPEGTTFLLEYSEDLRKTPQERAWLFGLTDGTSSFAFRAVQRSQAGTPMPPLVNFQDLGFMATFLEFLAPNPDGLPAQLPTVPSLTARWQAYESLEERSTNANGWGMALWCIFDCQYGLYGDIVAGKDPVALFRLPFSDLAPYQLPDVVDRTFTGSQLNVAIDGSTSALVNWTGYAEGLASGPLAGQPVMDPATKPEPSPPRLVLATFLPSPEQGVAISVVSALAGLLYWLWPSLKGGSFLGLFSRLEGPKLLAHPSRARLHQLVQAEPGIHFQDLVRRSGLANGTAVHHLHKLTQAGLLAARPLGRYTCYFPGASPDRASLAAAPVTRSDGARRILAELAAHPGLSGQEVALRLGLQSSTVAYHVKRLQDAGLVATQRDGRVVRLRAVAAG